MLIPGFVKYVIHAPDKFLHLREDQAGGTIVAQRFSWAENSLTGTLKFFQESRCFLITNCGVSQDFLRCVLLRAGLLRKTGF